MTQHHPKSQLFSNTCEICGSKPESGKNPLTTCVICDRKVCAHCGTGQLCKTHHNKLPKIAKRKLKKLGKNSRDNQRLAFGLTGLFGMVGIITLLVTDFNLILVVIFGSVISVAVVCTEVIVKQRLKTQVRQEYYYHFPIKITQKDLLPNLLG